MANQLQVVTYACSKSLMIQVETEESLVVTFGPKPDDDPLRLYWRGRRVLKAKITLDSEAPDYAVVSIVVGKRRFRLIHHQSIRYAGEVIHTQLGLFQNRPQLVAWNPQDDTISDLNKS